MKENTTVRKTIEDLIENLNQQGILARGAGYCFSMSEMLQTMLTQKSIESRIVEVKLTVMSQDPPLYRAIGHDDLSNHNEIDTHVVVITETEPPYLIDSSIFHLLQPFKQIPYILAPLDMDDIGGKKLILDHEVQESKWLYEEKPNPKMPAIHQQNLLARMNNDRVVKGQLRWLKVLVSVALVIAVLNTGRGYYDFYQKYIITDNNYGPQNLGRDDLLEEIRRLERLLQQK